VTPWRFRLKPRAPARAGDVVIFMTQFDYAALRATAPKSDPYDYLVVPSFVRPEALQAIVADFPTVRDAGPVAPEKLEIKGAMKALLDEMQGPEFRKAVEEKFDVDLSSRATLITVRGLCRARDGAVHTDAKSKIVTVLLYLNQAWDADGGRLRILRSERLDDYAEEVPPSGGALLIFKRSDRSFHGHESFEGVRRAIQLNWITDDEAAERRRRKRTVLSMLERLNPFAPKTRVKEDMM
jgi:SM-20-related protein